MSLEHPASLTLKKIPVRNPAKHSASKPLQIRLPYLILIHVNHQISIHHTLQLLLPIFCVSIQSVYTLQILRYTKRHYEPSGHLVHTNVSRYLKIAKCLAATRIRTPKLLNRTHMPYTVSYNTYFGFRRPITYIQMGDSSPRSSSSTLRLIACSLHAIKRNVRGS